MKWTIEDLEKNCPYEIACDKKNWGEGPWTNEPDHFEGIYKDYKFTINRDMITTGCLYGYVELPPESTIDSKDIQVYGGITYGGYLSHIDQRILGVNTAHLGDFRPIDNLYSKIMHDVYPKIQELNLEREKEIGLIRSSSDPRDYKTLQFVINECKSIIDQIIAHVDYKKRLENKDNP